MFKSLNRQKKAYEEVAEQIKDRIFAGELKRLDRLPPEREMADQFGVSRVAVREAVRVLELTGFVNVKSGAKGGVFVAQDYDRPLINSIRHLVAGGEVPIGDLFAVRYLIEPYAAARVAERGTIEDFAELSKTLHEAQETVAAGEMARALNFRFHRLIVRMSGNAILGAVGETVLTILVDYLRDISGVSVSKTQIHFHTDLLDAMMNRDGELSRRLMIDDIRWLENALDEFNVVKTRPWPPSM